jgi:hypothetical protein
MDKRFDHFTCVEARVSSVPLRLKCSQSDRDNATCLSPCCNLLRLNDAIIQVNNLVYLALLAWHGMGMSPFGLNLLKMSGSLVHTLKCVCRVAESIKTVMSSFRIGVEMQTLTHYGKSK